MPLLSVSNPDFVKLVGIARDFATCSWAEGKKKCSNVVDSRSKYCQDHLQLAFQKSASMRMECNQT